MSVLLSEIKDNHPRIYNKMIEIRSIQYGEEISPDNLSTVNCFHWIDAEEGWVFWNEIHEGNFSVFYDRYPEVEQISKIDEIFEEKVKLLLL